VTNTLISVRIATEPSVPTLVSVFMATCSAACGRRSAPDCQGKPRFVFPLDSRYGLHHHLSMKIVKQENGSRGSPIIFRLDTGSGVPTYLQLVHQVEHALRLGYLKVGDQLPKVKEVVAQLAINPNTVLKAYRDLERKGLAVGRPGRGTFIEATLGNQPQPGDHERLRDGLTTWMRAASEAGLGPDAMIALFTNTLHDFSIGRTGVKRT
jgi:GntR family transcriptional regulator